MVAQKTWIDLLGKDSSFCFVSKKDIVRCTGLNQFKILWTFETNESAVQCFQRWLEEIAVAP